MIYYEKSSNHLVSPCLLYIVPIYEKFCQSSLGSFLAKRALQIWASQHALIFMNKLITLCFISQVSSVSADRPWFQVLDPSITRDLLRKISTEHFDQFRQCPERYRNALERSMNSISTQVCSHFIMFVICTGDRRCGSGYFMGFFCLTTGDPISL